MNKKTHVILLILLVPLLISMPSVPVVAASSPEPAAVDADLSFVPTLVLEHRGQRWVFPLRDIGFDGIDPTTLNRTLALEWIAGVLERDLNRPARSAYYHERRIVPEQAGLKVDRQRIEAWFDRIHEVMGQPLAVPVNIVKPRLTAAKLRRLKEKQIGSYLTYYNEWNRNRAHNIHLATEAIDHKVLMPGEVFSFNKTVGPRSQARGYRLARIIVKGEYSEGVGGGICQTSSTLYNSVDKAGLKIVERQRHSKQVAYVPRGRDATVSWGGPDFKFQNQLNEPILIVAKASNGRLLISIYGPEEIHAKPRKVPVAPKQAALLEEVE
ncbi:hypothetical protein C1X05_11625 [Laceyella sacchari]|jgi:vancomycin resistance protein YoaR|uniref:VanW like protein n=1 Tax=Laceyella tengchongensis TaxID=574699 RepID=A0AA45WLT1_9BACL|nr:VanW family protein [Laceyella tengchongensis]AUS09399.1 hypothetical protein C1X05_11625 [Laceyella sacchari]SMP11793.1 VanW like protein [Laceyella tengchongensis]